MNSNAQKGRGLTAAGEQKLTNMVTRKLNKVQTQGKRLPRNQNKQEKAARSSQSSTITPPGSRSRSPIPGIQPTSQDKHTDDLDWITDSDKVEDSNPQDWKPTLRLTNKKFDTLRKPVKVSAKDAQAFISTLPKPNPKPETADSTREKPAQSAASVRQTEAGGQKYASTGWGPFRKPDVMRWPQSKTVGNAEKWAKHVYNEAQWETPDDAQNILDYQAQEILDGLRMKPMRHRAPFYKMVKDPLFYNNTVPQQVSRGAGTLYNAARPVAERPKLGQPSQWKTVPQNYAEHVRLSRGKERRGMLKEFDQQTDNLANLTPKERQDLLECF